MGVVAFVPVVGAPLVLVADVWMYVSLVALGLTVTSCTVGASEHADGGNCPIASAC